MKEPMEGSLAMEWRPPRRQRWSEEDGQAMLQALASSGESVEEFAKRHGLKGDRIRRWQRRRPALRSVATATAGTKVAFAPVRVLTPGVAGQVPPIEVFVGAFGVRLRAGFCEETARRILVLIGEVAC